MEYTVYILGKKESDNIRIVFKHYINSTGMYIDFNQIRMIHNYDNFGDNYVQQYTYDELRKYFLSLESSKYKINNECDELINNNGMQFHINFARNIYEFLVNELYYELIDAVTLDDDIF